MMRDLAISYGNSRQAKKWVNKTISFDALKERLKTTIRTTESAEAYASIAPAFYLKLDEGEPWHYGLKGIPRYAAGMGKKEILANLSARRVWFGCGTKDDARTNGRNRLSAKQGVSRSYKIEASMGFARWDGNPESFKESMINADKRMYEEKRLA